MLTIKNIYALEVLDSRGFPTVEVRMSAEFQNQEYLQSAIVPSGASTGQYEALELRDHDMQRYLGKGVRKAISHIQSIIAPKLLGMRLGPDEGITKIDRILLALDGTATKEHLGANAILPISMAYTRLLAIVQKKKLSHVIKDLCGEGVAKMVLPVPLMNILNGGKHATNHLDIQEFMVVPHGFTTFQDALRAGAEVFHCLKKILIKRNLSTGVGDEGGFAPHLDQEKPHEQAIELILEAIHKAGYKPAQQISLALDCAATEFYKDSHYIFEGKSLTSDQLLHQYQLWCAKYPIISIEDGFAEDDWAAWKAFQAACGHACQIVGDDLFVTNVKFLQKGIEEKAANALLVKLNQIGTVSETLDAMRIAHAEGFNCIVSHRSGETEDTFIADLAVGTGCGQIKAGSACRTDRVGKYNQLLRLESDGTLSFAGSAPFKRFYGQKKSS